jgi:MoxR-like ATPase
VKPSHLSEALLALLPEFVPTHLWGATGIGKSDILRSVAKRMDCGLIDLRAVLYDPVDLRGLPRIHKDVTEWIVPKFLPRSGRGILFLDELTSAPQMIQAACYQLVLDRRLGEYTLPDEWFVVAAGNPASERGVHYAMPRPLRDRFVHLTLEPDLQEWCQWAVTAGIRPEIIAFLRFKPGLLHDPSPSPDANAWPTPRGWEMVSKILNGHAAAQLRFAIAARAEVEAATVEGKVGPGAAVELIGFLRLFRELPSVDEILLSPDKAPVPALPSSLIAVATALGRALTPHSIGRGLRYLERIPTEFRVLSISDAAARDRSLTHTPEFIRFATQYAEVIQ